MRPVASFTISSQHPVIFQPSPLLETFGDSPCTGQRSELIFLRIASSAAFMANSVIFRSSNSNLNFIQHLLGLGFRTPPVESATQAYAVFQVSSSSSSKFLSSAGRLPAHSSAVLLLQPDWLPRHSIRPPPLSPPPRIRRLQAHQARLVPR